jgi:hypothetical protein
VFGPCIQFLTTLSENEGDDCLIVSAAPAGVVLPIQVHTERETFYVLEGQIQGRWEDRWITLGARHVFDVPGGLKLAKRIGQVCIVTVGRTYAVGSVLQGY